MGQQREWATEELAEGVVKEVETKLVGTASRSVVGNRGSLQQREWYRGSGQQREVGHRRVGGRRSGKDGVETARVGQRKWATQGVGNRGSGQQREWGRKEREKWGNKGSEATEGVGNRGSGKTKG